MNQLPKSVGAGNPHATFCGNRGRVTASGDPMEDGQEHPHAHIIVPGGGFSPDGRHWIACRPGFFLSVRVLSRLFRRLFLERLTAAYQAGRPQFFADQAALAERPLFAQLGDPRRHPRQRARCVESRCDAVAVGRTYL